MSNEKLTEKTLADVQAGIPARDAEIEALRKENAGLREQLEAIGAEGELDGVAHFTKKPVTISAIQWTGGNLKEVIAFTGMHPQFHEWFSCWDEYVEHVGMSGGIFKIFTLEGVMEATPGDWIIRGVKGEHYPCKPDIFAATYNLAQAQPLAQQDASKSNHAIIVGPGRVKSFGK